VLEPALPFYLSGKEKKIENYRLIKTYFFKYKGIFLAGLLFLAITNIVSLFIPWLLKYAIESLRTPSGMKTATTYALFIVLAGVVQSVFRVLSRVIIYFAGRKIEYDLRKEIMTSLLFLPLSFYQNMKTGDTMSRAVNDTSDVRMFMGPGFLQVLNTIMVYLFTLSMMLMINVRLTVYVLLPYPVLLFIANRYTKHLYIFSMRVQEQLAAISSMAHENLSGIQVIKTYCREQSEIERFKIINMEYLEKNMALVKKRGILMPLIAGVGGLSTLVLLWLGGQEIIAQRITLGDFVAFNGFLAMLLWPTIAMGWILNVLQRGLSAMTRINTILEEKAGFVPAVLGKGESIEIKGDINIQGLNFSYNDRDPLLLKNISLDIKKGSFVGIVGPIGSGKSTLLRLIPRLHPTKDGMIFVDGIDINHLPAESLRKSIGFVPQEGFLFSTTIRENISFGIKGESSINIEKYAENSGLKEEIDTFPEKLDSIVGERGITLSGGQRQRVAFARALAVEPKILILDDPFSSVDNRTEEEILKTLKSYAKERTLLLVSHRISTIKEADQIIVLEDGAVAEQGRHEELVRNNGFYARMFRQQQLREELDKI
jgi:ATP-binding cassette, subfamily B, multidrug efflux pump